MRTKRVAKGQMKKMRMRTKRVEKDRMRKTRTISFLPTGHWPVPKMKNSKKQFILFLLQKNVLYYFLQKEMRGMRRRKKSQ